MIELEDNVGDIVGKAQRGLGISDSQLAEKSGLNPEQLGKIRDGNYDKAALQAIAPILARDGGRASMRSV